MRLFSAIWLLLLASSTKTSASLIDDFMNSARSLWPVSKEVGSNEIKQVPTVNFELPTENEDFLKEGLALINAPRQALDLCTHRVISTLKKNCNQLSAEEVEKLAVMMLNCQLEIEGRPTYPCKPEMTLQQCTMGMDSQIHKIYSYMSHRAVGICSALKHDQFRAMTEMTINRLTQATQSQITAMHEALRSQQRLNEMEIENMREFSENDGKIKESQLESLEKLKHAGGLIEENLATLQHAIELRHKSEEQLSNIEKTTDEITSKLNRHSSDLQSGHEKLLEDVDKIAASLQKSNIELINQYNQTLEFLNNFKSLMQVLSSTAENLKSFTEKVLNTVHDAGLDLRDEFIVFMTINLAYFTSAMIFMLFVNAQGLCKLILVNLFVFNTLAAHNKAEVSLLPLNIFVWLCFVAFKVLTALKRYLRDLDVKLPKVFTPWSNVAKESDSEDDCFLEQSSIRDQLTPVTQYSPSANGDASKKTPRCGGVRYLRQTPSINKTISLEDSEIGSILKRSNGSDSMPSSRSRTPLLNRPLTPDMRRVLRDSLPVSLPERVGTPFAAGMTDRVQCIGTTVKGQKCKNAAVLGSYTCRLHN